MNQPNRPAGQHGKDPMLVLIARSSPFIPIVLNTHIDPRFYTSCLLLLLPQPEYLLPRFAFTSHATAYGIASLRTFMIRPCYRETGFNDARSVPDTF